MRALGQFLAKKLKLDPVEVTPRQNRASKNRPGTERHQPQHTVQAGKGVVPWAQRERAWVGPSPWVGPGSRTLYNHLQLGAI